MDKLISITQLNLERPSKPATIARDWREEIIYFIVLDRFHDGRIRKSVKTNKGFGAPAQLKGFCGGNLKGVLLQLDYIKSLGCTAIWLSPFLENGNTYHGYAIQNFLKIDPRFGTLQDLKDLTTACHQREMKVIMDVVVNHSGDVWSYKDESTPYEKGKEYPFGAWKSREYPVPIEFRNPNLYNRKGSIRNFDEYPETLEGDLFELKSFRNDDSQEARKVTDLLTAIYSFWINEADIDGFRIDAAKHFGKTALKRFVSGIKKHARQIGKSDFYIFAEVAAGDALCKDFLEEVPELDATLDFPLHFMMNEIIRGNALAERVQKLLLSRSQENFSVTFLDNHDQLGQKVKKRFAADINEAQFRQGVGFLFSYPGVPCIYYGTEQGLSGSGSGDEAVRECMFDLDNENVDLFVQEGSYFKIIHEFSTIRKQFSALSKGDFVLLQTSELTIEGKSSNKKNLIAFFRKYQSETMLVICNFSSNKNVLGHVRSLQKNDIGDYQKISGSPGHKEIFVLKDIGSAGEMTVSLEPSEILILRRINGKSSE